MGSRSFSPPVPPSSGLNCRGSWIVRTFQILREGLELLMMYGNCCPRRSRLKRERKRWLSSRIGYICRRRTCRRCSAKPLRGLDLLLHGRISIRVGLLLTKCCRPRRPWSGIFWCLQRAILARPVSYTHLRAHETDSYLVCRLLLE